jgi:hypothetical protein
LQLLRRSLKVAGGEGPAKPAFERARRARQCEITFALSITREFTFSQRH